MKITLGFAALLASVSFSATADTVAGDMPKLRAALQMSGTVAWEVDTIRHNGFDTANGFALEVMDVAGKAASDVALQAGEVDMIVSDWLWVARQRAQGQDLVFLPYSKAVGGIYVPADSPAQSLGDLAGGKIGIAGGPLDKSWLILRAFADQQSGFDLAGQTEQVFGAPPLIFKAATGGELDGAINFWHFGAKMEASGMRLLMSVSQAALALGLDPETPLLGYVVRGEVLRDHPEIVAGMAAASRQAKELLRNDSAAWERLRAQMNADTDAQFEALKAGWIAGIPADGPISEAAAGKMLDLMTRLGGADLTGGATTLPEGVFYQPAG
ncbi:NMT1/THI5 like protein [Aquimixticola soesokkakensis]|uniref:NMT1/THI5 like protein n=1 Tax=Aquimixticola soesokkakensis TaxID=1519096 RepID=A0A1Y5RVF6_9RHOB|nr:ABC transporter substrate-binding protein [Aquimixticola soesokkakensis]SLN25395.1 NMT1/THI5 like protein [Aquimixticola soesokkakensis]